MLAHRRGVWSWLGCMSPRAGLLMGSQKREQNPGSRVRILFSPHRAPPTLREIHSLKLSIWEKGELLLNQLRRIHPLGWGNDTVSPWDWSGQQVHVVKRFLFCWATSFTHRRCRLLLRTPMGVYGMWPFPLLGRHMQEARKTQTHKATGLLHGWGPSQPAWENVVAGWICLLLRLLISWLIRSNVSFVLYCFMTAVPNAVQLSERHTSLQRISVEARRYPSLFFIVFFLEKIAFLVMLGMSPAWKSLA